ncbi:MAG: RNA polymerase sigma factor [Oceanicaulis sp.]
MADRHLDRALDAYLAAAARAGDQTAQRDLVKRWQPRLSAHAWRLLGEADAARDVVQEAWARIVPGLGRLKDDYAFPAFAYQIVTRCCAAAIADKRRRRALGEAVAAEPEPETADPDRAADLDRTRRAVAALPADQRAAIALFHFEGLSVAETAAALDVPAGTIKTRLMHARLKLRAMLQGGADE